MIDSSTSRRGFIGGTGTALAALLVMPAMARGAASGFQVNHTPAQWRKLLGGERFNILREAGTERPFTSPLNAEHRGGRFLCAGCDLPLFASATKFDSHTGWPSFFRALPGAVATRTDRSLLMSRTEVLCHRCGGHLGHLFDDGPKPTGLRYCMNGLAMKFQPA